MKWCLASAQFKNHLLYWPTQACTPEMPVVDFTDEELDQVWGWMSAMFVAQLYLSNLPEDREGNYWLQVWPLLEKSLLWPVDQPEPSLKQVTIPPKKYDMVVAAFDGVDAMQTLIRNKLTTP